MCQISLDHSKLILIEVLLCSKCVQWPLIFNLTILYSRPVNYALIQLRFYVSQMVNQMSGSCSSSCRASHEQLNTFNTFTVKKITYFFYKQQLTQGPHIIYHLKDSICGIPYIILTTTEEASVWVEEHIHSKLKTEKILFLV